MGDGTSPAEILGFWASPVKSSSLDASTYAIRRSETVTPKGIELIVPVPADEIARSPVGSRRPRIQGHGLVVTLVHVAWLDDARPGSRASILVVAPHTNSFYA